MPRPTYSTAPILATCGKCGADGIIMANPSPRGSFQCAGTADHSVPGLVRQILLDTIARLKAGA